MFWLHTLIPYNPFIPLGIVAMSAVMGAWMALGGWAWSSLRARYGMVGGPGGAGRGGLRGGLLAATGWVAAEYLRSLGPYGFPWGQLGYSQQPCLPLLQTASIAGVYGISFLLVLANGFAADAALGWLLDRERRKHISVSPLSSSPSASLLASAPPPAAPSLLRPALIRLAGLAIVVVALGVWGIVRARAVESRALRNAESAGTILRVAALQPNVPQSEKWDSYTSPDPAERDQLQRRMTADLLDMFDSLAIEDKPLDLIVTPESVITAPIFNWNAEMQQLLSARAHDLGAPIFVGADDWDLFNRDGAPAADLAEAIDPASGWPYKHRAYVASWMIPPDRPFDHSAVYHKVRLVPFGEWVPWFNLIPGFQENIVQIGSFTPGDGPVLFAVSARGGEEKTADSPEKGADEGYKDNKNSADASDASNLPRQRLAPPQVRFSAGICFESIFSSLYRQMARRGAHLLANVTNDAWYGRSAGPAQHFQFSVLRAVETGRPLVRAANTGITAVISPAGRVADRIPFGEKGILRAAIPVDAAAPLTLYGRLGDWFALLCLALAATLTVGRGIAARFAGKSGRQSTLPVSAEKL